MNCNSHYTVYKFEEIKDKVNAGDDYPIKTGQTYGIDKSSIMLHCHDYLEICYIKQGTGTYLIDGNDFAFQTGDIFVIGSNELHLAYNDQDVIMLVVLFKPGILWNGTGYTFEMEYIQVFKEIRKRVCHKISSKDPQYDTLRDTLLEIYHEDYGKDPGYELVVKASILKFAAFLKRNFYLHNPPESTNKEKNYDLFLPVFEYVKFNYANKIKLEELAAAANMGVSTFSLAFKKSLGMTPIEYVNKIRVVKASQMLLETDRKVIDIANECGFFSLPHFISCFKKYTGKLPKDFRNIREYIK
ncbi:MAG: AraC family transcriptional regulator [Clostridia bacterium]|nr:AraC family transcriptional regulator [Clostridia bacterium]